MASSQIRQFASLIDQLPCDAEDFNLIENFEAYNKCFGKSIDYDNSKDSDCLFSYNSSNISDYLNNLSNCQFEYKRMQNTKEKKNSNHSINDQGNPMLLERPHINKNNQHDDYDKNMSLSDLINVQSNSCTNNDDLYRNVSTKLSFNSKYANDNNDINNNYNNSLFIQANDLTDQQKNNLIEKLKSPIILTNKKSINKNSKNKKKTLLKNNNSYNNNNNNNEENDFLANDQIINNNKQNDTYSQHNMKHPFNDNSVPCYEYNILQGLNKPIFNSNCENHMNNVYTNGQKTNSSNQIFHSYNNMTCSEMNSYNDVTQNVQTNSKRNELFDFNDMVERNHELSKHILLSKKAKVIKLESNKSLIIFPVNIHEYGNKYIAVNQEDLLEYISSSLELENEDICSLKIRIHQKEKELQNVKAAYSMQTTNIHYLINRVIFKECEYENLVNKNVTLENEIKKLINEMNYLISQDKDGLFMQKVFIDYKSKCVLKLQELQPFLGSYYQDIFNYITSCRTLGQLSIWLPAFEIIDSSLESIANHLIKILLNGLGTPFNICSEYFLSNQNYNKNNNISLETEEDFSKKNLEKKKIIENYLITNMNSINTNKENNYHLSNCQSLSLNSETSSFMEAEELFFNSSKYPSMHSVILRNTKDQKKKEKIMNQLNRSNTTPENLYTNNQLFTYSDKIINEDKTEFTNSQDFINNLIEEQHFQKKINENNNMIKTKQTTTYDGNNNINSNSNTQKKGNKKIRLNEKIKKNNNGNYNNNMTIKTNDENNTFMKTYQCLEGSKINEILRANETLIENEIETNIYKEKRGDKIDVSHFINENENQIDVSHFINVKDHKLHLQDDINIKSINNQFDQISNKATEHEEKKNITSKENRLNKNKQNDISNPVHEKLDETEYFHKRKSKDIYNIINQYDTEKSISRGCSLKGSMENIFDKNILTEYEKTASQNDIEQIEFLRNKSLEDETLEKGKMFDEHFIMLKKDEKIYKNKNKSDQELFSLKNKAFEEKQKQNEYSTDINKNKNKELNEEEKNKK
ncbi:asparagine-rich protein [Plasmodium falciparum IGH-CR14]|uniref:Asparagine-rich protein n=1 Tax=Plasmodium falciparum IGH-CR14 TaxID=580059 RepID=A0A0L1I9D4_PLAFA|nr:asparagine-rich protein [Plasmodium falciparum IGH-CR14]